MDINTILKMLPSIQGSNSNKFKKIVNRFSPEYNLEKKDITLLQEAFNLGEEAHKHQTRVSGEKYFDHCVEVCLQLIDWNMDINTIIAGLLHDTIEDTDITKKILSKKFGSDIAELVSRVTKLSGIKYRDSKHKQSVNFMKMFLSVSKDLRVIIIKFADRLHNIKTIKYLPKEKQNRIAYETRELYAPLAHRLGMNKLKMEYEDLTFEVLDKKHFNEIKKKIKATNSQRLRYINKFIKSIKDELKKYSIDSNVFGRAKHFYSIYNKMNLQTLTFNELYDLLAIRIIVKDIDQCYTVLGIVHQLYTPVQNKFKDYIATPKSNGYQSIHTTVFADKGEMMEVQIRTTELDQLAEIGVAAHWRYKDSNKSNTKDIDKHVKWLRELVENIQNDNRDSDEMLELLKIDLFEDEIFVFTPQGDVHQLKSGSTPIDFAFSIHSEIGFKCKGAEINGKIATLNTRLRNGDKVKIITSENHVPNHAWLKIVQTTKAKTHIKRFLNREEQEKSIELGKEILEKTLRRLKQLSLRKEVEKNPEKIGFNDINTIYSQLGKGKITVREIVESYDENFNEDKTNIDFESESITQKFINRARGIAKGVKVGGISNTMIYFPKCCNPIPGDEIIGYITRGKGVTIHRNNCTNIKFEKMKDRFIDVEWQVTKKTSFLVRLKITFEDRKHLLKDLTESTSSLDINIKSVDIKAIDGFVVCLMIVELRNSKELGNLKNAIKKYVNPISIERV